MEHIDTLISDFQKEKLYHAVALSITSVRANKYDAFRSIRDTFKKTDDNLTAKIDTPKYGNEIIDNVNSYKRILSRQPVSRPTSPKFIRTQTSAANYFLHYQKIHNIAGAISTLRKSPMSYSLCVDSD